MNLPSLARATDILMWILVILLINALPSALFSHTAWSMFWEKIVMCYGSALAVLALALGWTKRGRWIGVMATGTLLFHALAMLCTFYILPRVVDDWRVHLTRGMIPLGTAIWMVIYLMRQERSPHFGIGMIGALILVALSNWYQTQYEPFAILRDSAESVPFTVE